VVFEAEGPVVVVYFGGLGGGLVAFGRGDLISGGNVPW
jgi:hypothetical protein